MGRPAARHRPDGGRRATLRRPTASLTATGGRGAPHRHGGRAGEGAR
ncbi:DUF6380 family protein [Streptomyces sp. NPDC046831]